jgi:hypothetical protein
MRNDPFFSGTPRKILDMDGVPMEFPILYYDIRHVAAMFPVAIRKLKELLPHPNFKPVEMWPGTGTLVISAYEYHDTSIDPYNELAISVLVRFPPATGLPGWDVFSMLRRHRYSVYIYQLPVTTEMARKGGVYFYNFPKFLANIEFRDFEDWLEVQLSEDGEIILNLRGRKQPPNKSVRMEYHLYSINENVAMHSLVELYVPKFGMQMMGNAGEVELGDHRISRQLAKLGLGKAISGQYAEGMMTKLYDPDRMWDVETLKEIEPSVALRIPA